MVKLNSEMKAGTDAATVTDVQVNNVSQTIAKPNVVCPCPFCGLIPTITFNKSRRGIPAEAYIWHNNATCPITIKTRFYKNVEDVVKAWNKRA